MGHDDLKVHGDLEVKDDLKVHGDLKVEDDLKVEGSLKVEDKLNFGRGSVPCTVSSANPSIGSATLNSASGKVNLSGVGTNPINLTINNNKVKYNSIVLVTFVGSLSPAELTSLATTDGSMTLVFTPSAGTGEVLTLNFLVC